MSTKPGPWFKVRRTDGGTHLMNSDFHFVVGAHPLVIPDPELELLRLENRELRSALNELVLQGRRAENTIRTIFNRIVSVSDDLADNNDPRYTFDSWPAQQLLKKAQKRDPI